MDSYKCSTCGYTYEVEVGDEEHGIACGTKWDNLPENWSCPICNHCKQGFYKEKKCMKCA